MGTVARLLLVALIAAVGWACHNPASPVVAGYGGQWAGTTAQGSAVAFTITAEELLTTISVGHDFNGCSGAETFSNLNISIKPTVVCIPGPCSADIESYRDFGYSSGNPVESASVDINGLFLSTARAAGTVNFRNYPNCGTAIGVAWTATKR